MYGTSANSEEGGLALGVEVLPLSNQLRKEMRFLSLAKEFIDTRHPATNTFSPLLRRLTVRAFQSTGAEGRDAQSPWGGTKSPMALHSRSCLKRKETSSSVSAITTTSVGSWWLSQQVQPMLQQLLLGLAGQTEGTVMRVRHARIAESGAHLLKVGFLDQVPASIHGRGGVPGRSQKEAAAGEAGRQAA